MPAPEMFPPERTLRKITLDVDDLTHDLIDGLRVTLKIELTDGTRATIMSRVLVEDDAAELPQKVHALMDAFIWGDGARPVIAWAQAIDRSAMSRRVRSTL